LKSEYLKRMGWMVGPLVTLSKRASMIAKAPTTALAKAAAKMNQALDAHVAEVGRDQAARDLMGVWIQDQEWNATVSDMAEDCDERWMTLRRGRVGRALSRLIGRAHSTVPCSPAAVGLDPVKRGEVVLPCYGELAEAIRGRGEARARRLAKAVAEIAESVHRPCLERLWALTQYAAQTPPGTPPKFGVLIENLQTALPATDVALLVESRAAHVRNAVVHNRGRYDPVAHVMELRDLSGWHASLSPRELQGMANRMLKLEEAVWNAVSVFVIRTVWIPMFPFFRSCIAAARDRDAEGMRKAEAEFEAFRGRLFADLWRLHRRAADERHSDRRPGHP